MPKGTDITARDRAYVLDRNAQDLSFKAIAAASSLSERSVALIVRQYAAAAWRREKATARLNDLADEKEG